MLPRKLWFTNTYLKKQSRSLPQARTSGYGPALSFHQLPPPPPLPPPAKADLYLLCCKGRQMQHVPFAAGHSGGGGRKKHHAFWPTLLCVWYSPKWSNSRCQGVSRSSVGAMVTLPHPRRALSWLQLCAKVIAAGKLPSPSVAGKGNWADQSSNIQYIETVEIQDQALSK